MANTRFGNFSNLSQGKKPISDEEALAILTNLGFIGQEFIPGATMTLPNLFFGTNLNKFVEEKKKGKPKISEIFGGE